MDDLISRQDALDEVERLAKFFMEKFHEYAPSTIAVTDAIKAIPSARSADAVEVVRCKECVENDAQGWCWKFGYTMHDGDFCSFGERKTDG